MGSLRFVTLLSLVLPLGVQADADARAAIPPATASGAIARLAPAFERNVGQFPAAVRYAARGRDATAFVTDDGLVVALQAKAAARSPTTAGVALRFRFVGARRGAVVEGRDALPGRWNYLRGHEARAWRTGVPRYARVVRRGVYAGIDVVYYFERDRVEYDLVVAPGADLAQVRLDVDGAERISRATNGDLIVATAIGEVRQRRPLTRQGARGRTSAIASEYVLVPTAGGTEIRFAVGRYDTQRELVVDPVLDFGTYFGGAGFDGAGGVAVDASGAIYIAGRTLSASDTFPQTMGAFQTVKSGFADAFVAKLTPSGSQLVYATYIGGNGNDGANAVAVDADNQAVIAGDSTSTNYPLASAAQGTPCPGTCAVVTKLNAAGNGLVFSTYLGGNGTVQAFDVATDASRATYITGWTLFGTSFPTSPGAFQTAVAGSANAFVAKYAASGARAYATLLGGGFERGNSIDVDASGASYVVGSMTATAINGVTATAIGPAGGGDVMIAKLAPSGNALAFLTRIGGSDVEEGVAGALDANGNVFFTGRSFSTNLPSTPAAPGATNVALFGALNAAGTALTGPGLKWYGDTAPVQMGCALGGAFGATIALTDADRTAYVAGYGCPATRFPVLDPVVGLNCTPNCASSSGSFLLRYELAQPALALSHAKGSANLWQLVSGTPVAGGSGTNTQVRNLVVDRENRALLLSVSSGDIPTTADALDSTPNGGDDFALTRAVFVLPFEVTKSFEPDTIPVGGQATLVITIRNPNVRVLPYFFYLVDPIRDGLRVLSTPAPLTVPSATPAGCDAVFPATVLDDRIKFDSFRTIPPEFQCTYRFHVRDNGYAPGVRVNTTDRPRFGSGDVHYIGEPATATLTVTLPGVSSWTGGASNDNFSSAGNFDTAPVDGAHVVFPNGPLDRSPINDTSLGFGALDVTGTGYSFGGNTYPIARRLAVNGTATFASTIVATSDLFVFTDAGGSATLQAGLDVGPGRRVHIVSYGTSLIDGTLSGSGDAIFNGRGVSVLRGTGSGTGSLGVALGTLRIDGNAASRPVYVGVDGVLEGTGGAGAVTNAGTMRPGSPAQPYEPLDATSLSTTSTEARLLVRAQAAMVVARFKGVTGISNRLVVAGSASLAGTLALEFDAPPGIGARYEVVLAGSIAGRFARTAATPSTVFGEASYTAGTVTYTVTATDGVLRDGFE